MVARQRVRGAMNIRLEDIMAPTVMGSNNVVKMEFPEARGMNC